MREERGALGKQVKAWPSEVQHVLSGVLIVERQERVGALVAESGGQVFLGCLGSVQGQRSKLMPE